MMSSFSVSIPVMRLINEHQNQEYSNILFKICTKEIADRILVISLPVLALIDFSFHVSAFIFKSIRVCTYSLFSESGSFDEAFQHLQIAWLFRITLFAENFLGFFKPSTVPLIFLHKNPEIAMASGLLLSGSSEIFPDPSNIAGTEASGNMVNNPWLNTLINELSPEKHSLAKTFSNLKEFQNLLKDFPTNNRVIKIDSIVNKTLRFYTHLFEKLDLSESDPTSKKIIKGVCQRILLLMMTLSLPFLVSATALDIVISCLALVISLLKGCSLSDWSKELVFHLKIIFLSISRYLLTIPVSLTLGLYDPKKVQSLLFSPLFKSTQELELDFHRQLMERIQKMPIGDNFLLHMCSNTSDGETPGGHAYCLLISKTEKNYRLSVVNRGHGLEEVYKYHPLRKKDFNDVDCSWDNISFGFLNVYLKMISNVNDPKVKQNRKKLTELLKNDVGSLDEKKLVKLIADMFPKDAPNELLKKVEHYKKVLRNPFTTIVYDMVLMMQDPQIRNKVCEALKEDLSAKLLYEMLNNPSNHTEITNFESHHVRRNQRIGNCGISSLLGGISFAHAMRTNNFQDKREYKKFVYALKQRANERYGFLLNFHPAIRRTVDVSAVINKNLEKAKQKIENQL